MENISTGSLESHKIVKPWLFKTWSTPWYQPAAHAKSQILCADLSHGVDAFDEADVDDGPGCGQTDDHPPLQRAADLDVFGDVQRLAVPEVIHRSALLTLEAVAYGNTPHHTHKTITGILKKKKKEQL